MMNRPASERVSQDVARKIRLRTDSKSTDRWLDRQCRQPSPDRTEGIELPDRRHDILSAMSSECGFKKPSAPVDLAQ